MVQRREELHADPRRRRDRQRAGQGVDPLQGVLAVDVFHDRAGTGRRSRRCRRRRRCSGGVQVLEDLHLAAEVVLGAVAGGDGGDHHLDGDRPVGRRAGGPGRPRPCPRRRSAARSGSRGGSSGTGGGGCAGGRRATRAGSSPAPRAADGRPRARPRRSRGSGSARRSSLRLLDADQERALAGRDHVAVAEPRPSRPGGR